MVQADRVPLQLFSELRPGIWGMPAIPALSRGGRIMSSRTAWVHGRFQAMLGCTVGPTSSRPSKFCLIHFTQKSESYPMHFIKPSTLNCCSKLSSNSPGSSAYPRRCLRTDPVIMGNQNQPRKQRRAFQEGEAGRAGLRRMWAGLPSCQGRYPPNVDLLGDRLIPDHLWCHPRNRTSEGHLGAFITEFLRCAKV